MCRALKGGIVAVALSAAAGAALAGPVPLKADGSWFNFNVLDGTQGWSADDGSPQEFSFSSGSAFTLRITDFFFAGESTGFKVNGSYFGQTALVPQDFTEFAAAPDDAFGNPVWSQGTWVFGPGSYVFSGDMAWSPGFQGLMAISVLATHSVPEPAAPLLLLAALGSLAVARSTRRR